MSPTADTLLVIPALDEGARLPPFLAELARALAGEDTRILVVDDGSRTSDSTTMEAAAREHGAGFLRLPENLGKGGAVYAGWDTAEGGTGTLAFVDADGAVSASEVERLLTHYHGPTGPGCAGAALFAVREQEDRNRVQRTLLRRFLGGIFRRIVNGLFRLPVPDTQCGFKIVPREAYERVRPTLREPGFIFDIELARALLGAGVPLRHEPVTWCESPGTKLRLPAMARMLGRLLVLRLRS